MWTYVQLSGELLDPTGKLFATGYSGAGEGKNNPAMQSVVAVGPIPCGMYTMELITDAQGNARDYGDKKAPVIRLIPDPQNEMFHRAGFLMHGDNETHTASDGCTIFDHPYREAVWASGDHQLQVVSGEVLSNHDDVQEAVNDDN